jgi:prepilin-type N-terminal cleavage/methylation domain-containing protein
MHRQNGFTLIETGIVLVIVGLLMGAVLKGEELLTVARVRSLITFNDGIKAAYFGFRDRYRALPGDYSGALANIPNCGSCEIGNDDGQILLAGGPDESTAAWEHLSKAGFITGSYTYKAGDPAAATNTPVNPYGSLMQLIYDDGYQDGIYTTGPIRHNLKTGNNVPSNK